MYRLSVRVVTNSSQDKVEFIRELNTLKVWTKTVAVEGRANQKVIELVAKYLGVNKKLIQIISGFSSKNKIIQVEEE